MKLRSGYGHQGDQALDQIIRRNTFCFGFEREQQPVTQNVGGDGRMIVAFTLDAKLVEVALGSLRRGFTGGPMSGAEVEVARDLAKVTAVGIGMRTHAGVAHRFFSCLTSKGIPIHMALSTEIKVSCLIQAADCPRAVQALHREFFEGSAVGAEPEA